MKERRCAKYRPQIVERILDLYAQDYTITSICKSVGVSQRTFNTWREQRPEFAQALLDVEKARMENYALVARNSLMRKLKGYDVVETRVVTIPGKHEHDVPRIKEQHTIKKHVAADTAAIIFTLTNSDPAHWKNRQHAEVTGKDGKDLFASMTDDELETMVIELQRKLK